MHQWLRDNISQIAHAAVAITLIIVLTVVAVWVLHRIIDRFIRRAKTGLLPERIQWLGSDVAAARRVQRTRTMGSVLKSLTTGFLGVVALLMILSKLGLDIAPLLASAGIVGVALGFGAQNLVKDFLAGTFIILEDQYGVGDVIDVGSATGTVEAVTLRITRMRAADGTVWYVRNGEILRVGNKSHNWAAASFDVEVARDADLVKVRSVLHEAARDVWEDEDLQGKLVEAPEVWGAEALTPGSVTMRVNLKTVPLAQAEVTRELRERVNARFAHEGIALPASP